MAALTGTLNALKEQQFRAIENVIESELPYCSCGDTFSVAAETNPVLHLDAIELRAAARCRSCAARYTVNAQIASLTLHSAAQSPGDVIRPLVMKMSAELRATIQGHQAPTTTAATLHPGATTKQLGAILQQYAPSFSHVGLVTPASVREYWGAPVKMDATIAEWITKKLVEVGGKLHVSKLGGLEWKPQKIIDVADEMGFVQWPHLRLPKEHPLAA